MSWLYRIGRPVVWLVFKIFWRFSVKKQIPLPEGPLVLCCNHMHALDSVALALITRRQVHYMAKHELMHGFIGWLIRSLGGYPVDRDTNDMKAIRHTLTLLKENRVIGIFPEGHRYTDGLVHEFHPGAAMFALRTEANLIPVGLYATFRPFSKVRLVVGEAMDLSGYRGRRITSDDIQDVNSKLHERISSLATLAKELA